MADPNNDPSVATEDALYMKEGRELVATLLEGTDAMRKAGKKYLPKAPAESDDAYAYRLAISTLYNGMRRTVETLAGKPFSEPLKLSEDTPEQIKEWANDIDLQGKDLHAFAHTAFQQALADGLTHVLVDHPPTGPITLAEKKAIGARPYFVHIKHDQILGWRSERIAGVETLTQLRFMETVTEPVGLFGSACIQQIRVLEPTTWTTFRKDGNKEEWVEYDSGPVSLGAIPLATIYASREAYMKARPPLLDLAHLNVEHWQSSSDQSNILHIARVPILFASGFEDDKFTIGTSSAVTSSDPNATLQYVEHTGAAISAGRESIKDLEERMSLMGAQLLVKKPGSKTATEKAIDSADSDSALSLMARTCEDSLEQALQFMADWEKLGKAGTVELTGEIGGLDESELDGLMKARTLGLLSAETVFNEMQRHGVIADDIPWEEERKRLVAEGPPIAIGGSYEAPNLGGVAAAGPVAASDSGKLTALQNPEAVKPTMAATEKAKAKEGDAAGNATGSGSDKSASTTQDLGPLTAAIKALAEKPVPETPPIDWAPLIDALKNQPAPILEMDVTPIADAIKAIPQPVVNIPEQPAHTFNVDARTTVGIPEQPAPIVNVEQPAITVESPTVNVAPAQVTVQPAEVNVTVEKSGARTGTMTGPDGRTFSMEVKDK